MSNCSVTIPMKEGVVIYYLLTVLAGILVSFMVMMNGQLSENYGVYPSVAIIHFLGFVFALIIAAIKKVSFRLPKKLPLYYYAGGLITILTVLFNNLSFGKISVSAILALCLLGQSITSLIFDQYGFFNMPKSKFHPSKLSGIIIVLVGIVIMISFYELSAAVPIILSLLTGFTVVLSRTICAGLAEKTSALFSTLVCYAVAFVFAVLLMFAIGGGVAPLKAVSISSNPFIYLGGFAGVLIITLLNISVSKISSFYMTLILFAGQVFTALIVDYILSHTFSLPNFFGGMFVLAGLFVNVWIDKKVGAHKKNANS